MDPKLHLDYYYDPCKSKTRKNKDVKVYQEYNPILKEFYKLKYSPKNDQATQTYDFNMYFQPIWKTNAKIGHNQNILLKPYTETYNAYDLRFSRYLRTKDV